MRISEVSKTIVSLYNNEATRNRTPYLVGPSGVGKSDSVRQAVGLLKEQLGECSMYELITISGVLNS